MVFHADSYQIAKRSGDCLQPWAAVPRLLLLGSDIESNCMNAALTGKSRCSEQVTFVQRLSQRLLPFV